MIITPDASFPSLKHFFRCDEPAGGTAVLDSVGGVVATSTIAITKPNTKSIDCNASQSALASGAWTSIANKKLVLFAVGQMSNASLGNLSIGDHTEASVVIKQGSTIGATVSDGVAEAISASPLTYGAVSGFGAIVDGTNITSFEAPISTYVYSAKTPVSMAGLGAIVPGNSISLSNITSLYGFALFVFDGDIPADIGEAVEFMTENWYQGNKVVYPGWMGVA